MGQSIPFRTRLQEKEARLVEGMADRKRRMQNELYAYCADYFWSNYKGVFFAHGDMAEEILQETFIAFWEKIERKRIYVKDGIVMGKDRKPLNGSILTYFMGMARYKYLEVVKENPVCHDPESESERMTREEGIDPNKYIDNVYNPEEYEIDEIVADVISHMSPQCSRILTKFYYEEQKLEAILKDLPTIVSYDALKTKKNKCLKTLRDSAKEIHHKILKGCSIN